MTIIGTSHQEIHSYQEDAKVIFDQINGEIQNLVLQIYGVTYEGPDAEQFNAEMKLVVDGVMQVVSDQTVELMNAISQITSNISRSLGGQEYISRYVPPIFESPTPPGRIGDDLKIDLGQFDNILQAVLPQAVSSVNFLIDQNIARFHQIPRAGIEQRGWSGESREYAQNVVMPAQVEKFKEVIHHVDNEIASFIAAAKSNILSADSL